MAVGAVLFDLGGTLEEISSTPEEQRQAAARIRRVLVTRSRAFQMPEEEFYHRLMGGYRKYRGLTAATLEEKSPEEIWSKYYLRDFPEEQGVVAILADHLSEIWETSFYRRSPKPRAVETLQALKEAGYRTGVITNTTSRSAPYLLLERYGMLEWLDVILTSAGEGRRKPGPEMFYTAARLLGLESAQCAFVGDQVNKDLQGAAAAGYRAKLLIHSPFTRVGPGEEQLVDGEIQSLPQVVDWLRQNGK